MTDYEKLQNFLKSISDEVSFFYNKSVSETINISDSKYNIKISRRIITFFDKNYVSPCVLYIYLEEDSEGLQIIDKSVEMDISLFYEIQNIDEMQLRLINSNLIPDFSNFSTMIDIFYENRKLISGDMKKTYMGRI